MKMEQTERSETSAYKIQMPVNHPKERKQHSEQGESLKSEMKFTAPIMRCSPSSCYSPPPAKNIFISLLFSKTLSVFFSLNVRDQVLHPYITGKIIRGRVK